MALPRIVAAAWCAVLLGTSLTACKGRTVQGPGTTVTVTPSVSASSSPTSASTSSPVTPSSSAPTLDVPAPVTLGAPGTMSKLPAPCDASLPESVVSKAVGGFTFRGVTQFVVGLPDKGTGRVGYLNCRYGVDSQAPKLEINVGLYRTATQARARITPTVRDFATHDAAPSPQQVSGFPTTVLTGGTDTGYGPTIVMAYGQRTIAVTLGDEVLPQPSVTAALESLASVAARRTSS